MHGIDKIKAGQTARDAEMWVDETCRDKMRMEKRIL